MSILAILRVYGILILFWIVYFYSMSQFR